MTLTTTYLTAGKLAYNPIESVCIIYKKIACISIIMRRQLVYGIRIANKPQKTENLITAMALITAVTTSATNGVRTAEAGCRKK